MVVGIKPDIRSLVNNKAPPTKTYIPLLHLGGRDVNTISLAATAHGEVNIQWREVMTEITFGNNIECS